MTVKEAVAILTKKYPGRVVLGYWEDGDDYIFNTKPIKAIRGLAAPGQFVATKEVNKIWRYRILPFLNTTACFEMPYSEVGFQSVTR